LKAPLIIFFALLFLPVTVHALPANGHDLLVDCNSTLSSPLYTECLTFVAGVVDGVRAVEIAYLGDKHTYFELDDRATNGQAAKVVTKFLKDHPEFLHMDATVLVLRSLHKAFPPTNGE
jgi:Rap1a immunity proteins